MLSRRAQRMSIASDLIQLRMRLGVVFHDFNVGGEHYLTDLEYAAGIAECYATSPTRSCACREANQRVTKASDAGHVNGLCVR